MKVPINHLFNPQKNMKTAKDLHREFVQLGRERNRITYKLLALLPKIYEEKIYEKQGYGNIYEYAARIAGLSPGVVQKTIKLEKKLKDKPHLQKAIETQGINKVGIVAGLATKENEKDLADKVTHMSKPALQEYSKELRGKVTVSWQVELDEEMMFMFLELKKKLGKNLSNKETLRKILEIQGGPKKTKKIPGEKVKQTKKLVKIPREKVSRYVATHKKRDLSPQCSHPGCCKPAETIHHPDRFSETQTHENLKPLCKEHHEFAHNGISEPMQPADYQYRKYRQKALL